MKCKRPAAKNISIRSATTEVYHTFLKMYMDEMKIYLSAPPNFVSEAARYGAVSAMAYRIGRDLRLYQSPMPEVRRALMDVDASSFSGCGPHEALVRQLVCQCFRSGHIGLVMDLPRPNGRLFAFCEALGRAAARYDLELYLPERYARCAPDSFVLVPAQNTSGTYAGRLARLKSLYGAKRLALEAERVYTDFTLPCRSGTGHVISPAANASPPPDTRFSPELCANTASFIRDGRAHLVVWDDRDTLSRKLEIAGDIGIRRVFFYYPHVSDIISSLL